ncbi:MAG: 3-isopropylmalate dehydratase large subunit [Nitrososphaerales archaeon]
MGKTIAEKIISEHAERNVSAGETAIVKVDYTFTHDASGPLFIKQLKELGATKLHNPKHTIIFIDHAVPSPRKEISNEQNLLRKFATEAGCIFHEAGSGICHQLIAEYYASPGQIIVGTDSHTVTAGALTAFATGMGATDVAVAAALGKTWFRVPETFAIQVDGKLQKGVYGKDIILHLIGVLGADGATYKALEFIGSTIDTLPITERLVLCNMVVEAGAKAGFIPSDEVTRRYLAERGRAKEFREIRSDSDANYERVIKIDASILEPQVACPHSVDNVKPISKVEPVKVDIVFIGSCTNARLEDLHIAAAILNGKKIHPETRLIVTPASKEIYSKAMADGTLNTLMDAGALITPPGCGLCFGALGGIPADAEVVFTTTNRNFVGRTGNPNAFTYLGSPATAAATALKGRITDPREVM